MTVKEKEYPELLADWKELVNMDVRKTRNLNLI